MSQSEGSLVATNWDRRYLELAKHVASWSKDPSTQVGAVIVNRNRVVSLGYNGFASMVADTPERWNNRELKYKLVVHAEQNAIISAGDKAIDSTLYVYPSFGSPNICHDCAKLAIQAGIAHVVGYKAKEPNPRWAESLALSAEMFREAMVTWHQIEEE